MLVENKSIFGLCIFQILFCRASYHYLEYFNDKKLKKKQVLVVFLFLKQTSYRFWFLIFKHIFFNWRGCQSKLRRFFKISVHKCFTFFQWRKFHSQLSYFPGSEHVLLENSLCFRLKQQQCSDYVQYRGDNLTIPMLIIALHSIFNTRVTGILLARLDPWVRSNLQWSLNRESVDSHVKFYVIELLSLVR